MLRSCDPEPLAEGGDENGAGAGAEVFHFDPFAEEEFFAGGPVEVEEFVDGLPEDLLVLYGFGGAFEDFADVGEHAVVLAFECAVYEGEGLHNVYQDVHFLHGLTDEAFLGGFTFLQLTAGEIPLEGQ